MIALHKPSYGLPLLQAHSVKLNRCYVTCFNVAPSFAETFSLPKSKGAGEFQINFLSAAFHREGEFGEFFLDFDEKVWEHKVVERFEELGASQVSLVTFKNNDGHDSAAGGLNRVRHLGARTGYTVVRGTPSEALRAKAEGKWQAEQSAQQSRSELDEKTQAAIKESLSMVNDAVIVVKEEVIRGNETLQTKIGSVQQGVCETIPYYQAEIARLKASLQHQTLLADRAEKRLADTTRIKNKLKETTEELDAAKKRIAEVEKTVRLYETMESAENYLKTAAEVLTEARFLKRARAE